MQASSLPVATAMPADRRQVLAVENSGLQPLRLVLRRQQQALDVIIQGAGSKAQISGRLENNSWNARLIPSLPSALPLGNQRLDSPSFGIRRVELAQDSGGFSFSIQAQPDLQLVSPLVSSNGSDLILRFPAPQQDTLVKAGYDLNQPGRLPQSRFAPPLQARAVAPPVGDMAIGSMLLRPRGFLQVSGPPVNLTTKGADARDLLMTLARIGGYSFAFSEEGTKEGEKAASYPVTVAFKGEPFGKAFNFVLMASGLQARLEGAVILVGKNVLAKTIGNQMSKVFRLNQVDPSGAADYLANLGASISKTNTITITSNEGSSTATGGGAAVGGSTSSNSTTQQTTQTVIEAYGSTTGPLLGLQGVTDSRLGTITLVGDPQTIAIAEGYLRQLDLRKRQVAVEVKIINVDLSNNMSITNNAYYKTKGGYWFISKAGRGYFTTDNLELPANTLVNPETGETTGIADQVPPDTFLDSLEATIESTSAKTLASPTLLIQEGNLAKVEAVKSVITDVSQTTSSGGNITCSQTREDAGLLVPIEVKKIDDNGFVTLNMKPSVSVPEPAGVGSCAGSVPLFNIVKRELDSGLIRLRDGQTLVLTGVISDEQRVIVQKVPILGDLPLVGQFFRQSANSRQKSELIILATPRIVGDDDGSTYGYGSISGVR